MLRLKHIELKEANEYVKLHHRHHKPVLSHRFSLCAIGRVFDLEHVAGVAIVGRPVARHTDWRTVVEVLRLCSDGEKNTCSFLYGACARAAVALGYSRVQTFILETEPGTSLVAAGWTKGHTTDGGSWTRAGRSRREDQPQCAKQHWYREL